MDRVELGNFYMRQKRGVVAGKVLASSPLNLATVLIFTLLTVFAPSNQDRLNLRASTRLSTLSIHDYVRHTPPVTSAN